MTRLGISVREPADVSKVHTPLITLNHSVVFVNEGSMFIEIMIGSIKMKLQASGTLIAIYH